MSTSRGRRILSTAEVKALISARSVALIGATDRSGWSRNVHRNLGKFGPDRQVFCVSRSATTVHGQPAVARVADIGEPVDLAYVMVPARAVPGVMQEVAEAGIRNVVLLSSGFAEAGTHGQRLQDEISRIALDAGVVVSGPNSPGFVNATDQNVVFGLPVSTPLRPGPVGIAMHSGGLSTSLLQRSQSEGVGLSTLFALGNETGLTLVDSVGYLCDDESTKSIAIFVESIRQPQEFLDVARKAERAGKPLVALLAGRSPAGQAAVASHTGAIVGDFESMAAALVSSGVIVVETLEDLITTSALAGYCPTIGGRRVAVVASSGGGCDLIADLAHETQLELPEFPEAVASELASRLPAFASVHNPLDVTGHVLVEPASSAATLDALSQRAVGEYDLLLFQSAIPRDEPPDVAAFMDRYRLVAEVVKSSPVPTLTMIGLGSEYSPFGRRVLDECDLFALSSVNLGLRAVERVIRFNERLAAGGRAEGGDRVELPAACRPEPAATTWTEFEGRAALEAFGIPVVPGVLVNSVEDAVVAAQGYGGPVVLKVLAHDLLHKGRAGGLAVGVVGAETVSAAYTRIVSAIRTSGAYEPVHGVLVSPMRFGGLELLVGVRVDRQWGPLLTVGLGGSLVEALRRTATRALPLSQFDIADALREAGLDRIVTTAFGSETLERVVQVVTRIAELADSYDHLASLEVNPLWVDRERVDALDVIAEWQPAPGV